MLRSIIPQPGLNQTDSANSQRDNTELSVVLLRAPPGLKTWYQENVLNTSFQYQIFFNTSGTLALHFFLNQSGDI